MYCKVAKATVTAIHMIVYNSLFHMLHRDRCIVEAYKFIIWCASLNFKPCGIEFDPQTVPLML
jgi:hypothetical protein